MPKTVPTGKSVAKFIAAVPDPDRRRECKALAKILSSATGEKPKMWGSAIVGFGSYRYKYASGHEGVSCFTGFSPRKGALTVYLMGVKKHQALLAKLGKHKVTGGCLYLKQLDDVDAAVLGKLVKTVVRDLRTSWS